MHGYGGIDQIASQRSEAGKCPLLVGPGKLAESDHIRRKKAASFRVSAMAVPSPHARLARLLIGLYRLWVQHLIQHLLGVGPRLLARGHDFSGTFGAVLESFEASLQSCRSKTLHPF